MIEILRHGAGVEVVAPAALRTAVRGALEPALRAYRAGRRMENWMGLVAEECLW